MPSTAEGAKRPSPGETMHEAILAGRRLALRVGQLREILTGPRPVSDNALPDASCDGALGRQQMDAFFTIASIRAANDALDEIEGAMGIPPGASMGAKLEPDESASERPRHQTGAGVGSRTVPRYD